MLQKDRYNKCANIYLNFQNGFSILWLHQTKFIMQTHYYIIFIAGLIPLMIGFVWYNPKVFGNAWMKSINVTEES